MRGRCVLVLALLAAPAQAQSPQLPAVPTPAQGLTPLGPMQAPLPNAPSPQQAPGVTPLAPIPSQPLPDLSPPPPDLSAPDAATPPTPTGTPAPPRPPQEWQPRGGAELVALDKVTARRATLSGKVGETLQFGSLSIVVRSCVARPPDEPKDAAAYLDITDSHAGAPGFHGWTFAAEPSVSMLEHPIYDVTLMGCLS